MTVCRRENLDVLSERAFFARGALGEISLSGGLTWKQLSEVIQTALSVGGCRGWSLAIYNSDLDPDSIYELTGERH